jgi:NADH-quinone oxidoreductase subunit G
MELIPEAYLVLNPEDAKQLDVASGELLLLTINEVRYTLPAKLIMDIPTGIAGLPIGLPQLPFVSIPVWGKIEPVT